MEALNEVKGKAETIYPKTVLSISHKNGIGADHFTADIPNHAIARFPRGRN